MFLKDEISSNNLQKVTKNFISYLVKKGFSSASSLDSIRAEEELYAKEELKDDSFIDIDEVLFKQFAAHARQQMFVQNL